MFTVLNRHLSNCRFALGLACGLVSVLAACRPTWVIQQIPPTADPPAGKIYVLREAPPAIIEIDRRSRREERVFPLASQLFDELEPEGLAYVPNRDVGRYGLFELPESVHGGYFLVAEQSDGRLHIFDVPLTGRGDAVEVVGVIIPELDDDASAVYYAAGEIWIVSGRQQTLSRITTVADGNDVRVLAQYSFDDLPVRPGDIEGLAFKEPGVVFLADDFTQQVYRYDDFPACLAGRRCESVWVRTFGAGEPSGAAWDARTNRLLLVDDEGEIFSVDENGRNYQTIRVTGEDLEGIIVIPPK